MRRSMYGWSASWARPSNLSLPSGPSPPAASKSSTPASLPGSASSAEELEHIVARERAELDRRLAAYRGNRPPIDVRGKTILLVDDGLATGASMHAAIASLLPLEPARIVVAVPVSDPSVCQRLASLADELVCLHTPPRLDAVGQWYEDFSQTTDEEVHDLLAGASGQ